MSAFPFDFRLSEGRDLFLFISVSLLPTQGLLSTHVTALNLNALREKGVMTRKTMRRGKRWKPGGGQAPMADFCMSPWGQGWFCVQKWFRTGLRVRGESRGSGSPRDCSTLHLPIGVSLWKSTSELKPNKKSIKSKLIYALSFPKPVSQNASWADISPFPFMSTLVSSEAAVTHFISTINGTDRLIAK